MTIQEAQQQIIDDFSFFEDWQDRYDHLISLGKSLPPMPEEDKQPENLVQGCQSSVWLSAHLEGGKVRYTADSDAILPKGIAALLVQVYSGHTPQEILKSNEDFIAKIGLQEFLSPTRANGLLAMIKQIKFYAIAFDAKNA
ncbi:SufE family protein [Ornithobacterium rhinotracheale]|uniref:SufE family protein n=1 Tax=Ornithobacterium rhinotracheale TaxID=28251 RepID=UPI00129CEFC1|nr:SufE family protein [Ornithobacterium rhinotracheale]MRJ08425.1 SufE family protein [Ornithobacterium rhinotracheale]UOH77618.1 SufE family protein [Ornithobacterium rhinotracheale]